MVSVGVTAPFTAVHLHAVAPQARASKHQVIGLVNGRVLAWSPGSCRAMASSTASEGVQHNSSHDQSVPKLEPFNQSRISRLMREPSLLEKAEHALAEKCMVLEGNEAFRCWEALFEFENIKEAYKGECDTATGDDRASACRPLERFQNLVRQSGGVSGLIDNIHMLAKTAKLHKEPTEETPKSEVPRPVFPEDGGLPLDPVEDESVADESGLLPESSLTRMLRHNGRSPAWYTHRPDHESD
ncbi:hypothetical protein M758_2G075500 [Ceratodon purpureus]|uniref:Uncharacterized protein n=1 Tax=Ceratodon purpureus TaxID=3225 RepID=A0A8T0ITV0_CERPU|nr:hypothetical protein KC19_2G097600 [Ceratodon purpureus]KAG0586526.1 hypothetical protein KC19_2G097600 [Ceratodon purpureus]KAG0625710.1 hypothetical protein M758_2G075500 [Ceratodon purpureus]